MTRLLRAFVLFLLIISFTYGRTDKTQLPPQGVIPDEVTAVRVAEAILQPIFGAEEVTKYPPYHAHLKEGLWTVYGTLKPGSRGGTPQLTLQKKDGTVIEVWYSQ